VEESKDLLKAISNELVFSELKLEENLFLMCDDDEVLSVQNVIDENTSKLTSLRSDLLGIEEQLTLGEYQNVRAQLSDQASVTARARACLDDLKTNGSGYCLRKRNQRDQVVWNEWYLKSRLKKPLKQGLSEKPEELTDIPKDMFKLIPVETTVLREGLSTLSAEIGGSCPPCLNNSLGERLVKHRKELDHVLLSCADKRVQGIASAFYNKAIISYMKVMELNDAVVSFYRTESDDGHYTVAEYDQLLSEQRLPLECIHTGDSALDELSRYVDLLHSQHYSYVSSHRKRSKTFHHTRLNFEAETESYTTKGYVYFYTITRVSPGKTSEKEIEVGEKDNSFFDWDYEKDEQVGWVREWKKLHEDNQTVARGWKKDLKPVLSECSFEK